MRIQKGSMCEGTEVPVIKIITATEFELNCLDLIDQVEEKGVTFIITRDGLPIARMMPAPPEPEPPGA